MWGGGFGNIKVYLLSAITDGQNPKNLTSIGHDLGQQMRL